MRMRMTDVLLEALLQALLQLLPLFSRSRLLLRFQLAETTVVEGLLRMCHSGNKKKGGGCAAYVMHGRQERWFKASSASRGLS